MKAKKLPSGKWRVQVYLGKTPDGIKRKKSFTADSKKDAEFIANEYLLTNHPVNMTVRKAFEEFLAYKSNTYSPGTYAEYERRIKNDYEMLLDIPLEKLSKAILTKWVNQYSATRSPKTVKNAWAILNNACKLQEHTLPSVTLPQVQQPTYILPTDEEVQKVIKVFRDRGDIEMVRAIMFGAYGMMRRGEIMALTLDDFNGSTCHISKSLSKNKKKEWVIKPPKTVSSDRFVTLANFVMDELPKEGPLFTMTPDALTRRFEKVVKKLGYEFNFHSLRHYCASTLIANGVDEFYVQRMGGWSTDRTLKNVYRNVMPEYMKKSQEQAIKIFEKFNRQYAS